MCHCQYLFGMSVIIYHEIKFHGLPWQTISFGVSCLVNFKISPGLKKKFMQSIIPLFMSQDFSNPLIQDSQEFFMGILVCMT